MRIQLIHPPHPTATDDKLDVPLGLLYVAASLEKHGHEVRVTDLAGYKNPIDWRNKIMFSCDIYGISSYVCTMGLSAEIGRMCREKNPEAWIVGGGANLTGLVETGQWEHIPDIYNSIIVGAGELAILDLIEDLGNGRKPELTYEHPLSRDLDEYPNPDYELLDNSDVHEYHRTIGGDHSISILTSRGCPYRCNFCGLQKQSRTVRYRSPEAVAREIQDIIDRYGIKAFNFQDDTFIIDKKRVRKLMDLIGPMGVTFRCLGRAGLDTYEDYVLMREAGCQSVAWGIESGSQRMLDLMNKQVTVKQNYEVIEWAKKAGVLDRIFLIVGFPGETRETLEETKQFIVNSDPSQYLASTFQPYPGIPVTDNPEKFGVTKIYLDFEKYIQVNGQGLGGHINIDTVDWTREEFKVIQTDFREWLLQRRLRGPLQSYENRLRCMKGGTKDGSDRDRMVNSRGGHGVF